MGQDEALPADVEMRFGELKAAMASYGDVLHHEAGVMNVRLPNLPKVERIHTEAKWLSLETHLTVDESTYHWWFNDSGRDFVHKKFAILDDLLYFVFGTTTQSMATEWDTRFDRPYTRRHWFAQQEALMAKLNPAWEQRARKDHERILKEHPFEDK